MSVPDAAPNLCGLPRFPTNGSGRYGGRAALNRYGQAKGVYHSKRPRLTVDARNRSTRGRSAVRIRKVGGSNPPRSTKQKGSGYAPEPFSFGSLHNGTAMTVDLPQSSTHCVTPVPRICA